MPDLEQILPTIQYTPDALEINGWEMIPTPDEVRELPHFAERELPEMIADGEPTGWYYDSIDNNPTPRRTVPCRCPGGKDMLRLIDAHDFTLIGAIKRSARDVMVIWTPGDGMIVNSQSYNAEVANMLHGEQGSMVCEWYGARLPADGRALTREELDNVITQLTSNLRYQADYSTREAQCVAAECRRAFVDDDAGDTYLDFIRITLDTLDSDAEGLVLPSL